MAKVSRIGIASELVAFSVRRRSFALLPLVVILALLSGLVVFAETSAIAPFLYPFF
jgi:hypothetical protein